MPIKDVPPSPAKLKSLFDPSKKWTLEQYKTNQFKRLKGLLNYAKEFCPFYEKLFQACGFSPNLDFNHLDDLVKLPLLTKQVIQRNFDSMRSKDASLRNPTMNSTGGSTGHPLNIWQDDNYRLFADAARVRAWRRFPNISNWAVEAVLWGADRDVGKGFSPWRIAKQLLRYRTLPLNTFDLDPDTIRRFFRIFNVVRPPILRGYASSLFFVAKFLDEQGISVHKPKIIISSADRLWPEMRETIEGHFKGKVLDSYGCREVSQIGTECSYQNGYHLVMENQYVELVDNQIVVTNFHNKAMPLIRYVIGDLANSIDSSPCQCGLKSQRLVGLQGRIGDTIMLPNGKAVHGEFFTHLFYGHPEIRAFQVKYAREQSKMRVVISTEEDVDHIIASIRQTLFDSFQFSNIEFMLSDRFDVSANGKFRTVFTVDNFETNPNQQVDQLR